MLFFLYISTRRERLKSALYLSLKRRKVFENVKGGTLETFSNPVCCEIKKLEEGPFDTKKKFRKKVAQGRKKIKGVDPVVPSGIVSYVKNGVHESGDTLH